MSQDFFESLHCVRQCVLGIVSPHWVQQCATRGDLTFGAAMRACGVLTWWSSAPQWGPRHLVQQRAPFGASLGAAVLAIGVLFWCSSASHSGPHLVQFSFGAAVHTNEDFNVPLVAATCASVVLCFHVHQSSFVAVWCTLRIFVYVRIPLLSKYKCLCAWAGASDCLHVFV